MAREGLAATRKLLHGEPVPEELIVIEHGARFEVDIANGHKTGFYLDQRDNRRLVRDCAAGRAVLDCFAYSGGFSVNALLGGASSVTAVDSSQPALAQLARNLSHNQLPAAEVLQADAFQTLRRLRDAGRRFDLIVLDPPKLAPTAASVPRAARAYKDINLLAFKLLQPGGLLFTFSCSGAIDRALFQKIVAGAALDAGVDAQFTRHLSAGEDHPVSLVFPEGEYLKGLCVRVR